MYSCAPCIIQFDSSSLLRVTHNGKDVIEDAGVDTDSLASELRSADTVLAETTILLDDETECERSRAHCNDLRTPLPDTRSASQPSSRFMHTQTGYFKFPYPLSMSKNPDSPPEYLRSGSVTGREDNILSSRDDAVTRVRGSLPSRCMSTEESAERGFTPPVNKERTEFLPLLKDESN